ncbi:hypothetical protein BH20ACT9_BH20ACT9_12930 [soil metagenome]
MAHVVVAGTALQLVGARLARQPVGSGLAEKLAVTRAADHDVAPGASDTQGRGSDLPAGGSTLGVSRDLAFLMPRPPL